MGNMDKLSNDSWTTVSSFNAPAHMQHQQQPKDFVSYIPTRLASSSSDSGGEQQNINNNHLFHGLEVEAASSWSDQSWVNRIRWFRNTRSHRDSVATLSSASPPTPTIETAYIGGEMESAPHHVSVRTKEEKGYTGSNHSNKSARLTREGTFTRIASWMTSTSSQHDEESVLEFHESEWTPPDSSYGAACPLFGWIPKKTRQYIEFVIVLFLILCLVYLVVILAIMITEARRDDSIAEDNGSLNLDDDRYIGYTDDKSYARTDDDDDDAY